MWCFPSKSLKETHMPQKHARSMNNTGKTMFLCQRKPGVYSPSSATSSQRKNCFLGLSLHTRYRLTRPSLCKHGTASQVFERGTVSRLKMNMELEENMKNGSALVCRGSSSFKGPPTMRRRTRGVSSRENTGRVGPARHTTLLK